MSNCRRLLFRCGSVDNGTALKGFDWVTLSVRLTDSSNNTATVQLFNPSAPSTTYLPDYPGSGSNVYDRFVDVSVMLSQFTGVSTSAVAKVELIFTTAAGSTRQFYMDDLRFE
jgi:hypothetical protein